MNIVENVIRDLVTATNVVADRVSLLHGPQVPQPKLVVPYITISPVGVYPKPTMEGPLQLIDREYQFSIFDSSQSRGLAIGDTVRQAFDGARGDYELVRFGACFNTLQTWGYESDTKLFQIIQQYRFLYRLLAGFATQTRTTNRSTNRSAGPQQRSITNEHADASTRLAPATAATAAETSGQSSHTATAARPDPVRS